MLPDELRQMVRTLGRLAWRRKSIHMRPDECYRVIAIDGHEINASQARCCGECLVREVTRGKHKVLEYYHRVVVAQWIGVTPPPLLDLELVGPKEGEIAAARRLLQRVLLNFSRLIDVISADALYLEAPFLRLVLDSDKHFVVVMKQERRDLYRDAEQIRSLLKPQILIDGPRTTRLWDIPELTSFPTLDTTVRVVWAEEKTVRTKIMGGRPRQAVEHNTWVWVTDLPSAIVPPTKIQRWGHDRWDLENRGFNELTNLWHMDHYFVHDPTAIQVMLLTLALAFLTTYLFYARNLNPPTRRHLSRLALAARFAEDLTRFIGTSVWPQRPG